MDDKLDILLVEDNLADAALVIEASKEGELVNFTTVENGIEALSYLRKEGKYKDVKTPNIIFLDLNLPKKNGHEFLSEIKQDEYLKRIPIIILTSSKSREDILKSYNLYANCYIQKPVDFDGFVRMIQSVKEFWLSLVTLPSM